MPLGWERINAKRSAPNKNIVFIKPKPGPEEHISKDYLERIAAQCLPIMNKHHLAVASLEEFEPNLEFWGRNFNNGEVIQLVLKSPSTGRWLPFNFVQMVMMHELAHIKQMNHSKAFWVLRNEYSADMKALWARGYTGDGLWGRGILLENGNFSHEQLGEGEVLPEHMCGGGFVSRSGRKRKIKPKITYKEAKERRIKKKFGENGKSLGADDESKVKLENGKRVAGKPRVAGSKRGRELRAAAALARFDEAKKEPEIKDEDLVTDTESESEAETSVYIKTEPDDAVDIDGQMLLDSHGRGLVKVCEEEDKDDENAKKELMDLQSVTRPVQLSQSASLPGPFSKMAVPGHQQKEQKSQPLRLEETDEKPAQEASRTLSSVRKKQIREKNISTATENDDYGKAVTIAKEPLTTTATPTSSGSPRADSLKHTNSTQDSSRAPDQGVVPDHACPVCSAENEPLALTCMICSNVLKPDFVPNAWRCRSLTCQRSAFVNAGDVALCGVCGEKRTSS